MEETGFPPALFPSFRMMKVSEKFQPQKIRLNTMIELTGLEFLRWYSASTPQIGSTCGLFDTVALRNIVGGVEELCASTIGYYCEHLFLVKCALLGRIVYIDAPFYVYRRHADSASESNVEVENHMVAGQELVRRCGDVLRHPTLIEDFSANLMKFSKIHIITFAYVSSRFEFAQKKFGVGTIYRALSRHWQECLRTKKTYYDQGGAASLGTSLAFFKVTMYCSYISVRLLLHFFYSRIR